MSVEALTTRAQALWHALREGEATWLRYALASVVALGADTGLFMLLVWQGLLPVTASAIGYCTGIIVHWLVSSRAVFADETAARGTSERHKQKMLFVGSALVGLALTMAIVGGAHSLGMMPMMAKIIAIIVSFQATYVLRRTIVFRDAARG